MAPLPTDWGDWLPEREPCSGPCGDAPSASLQGQQTLRSSPIKGKTSLKAEHNYWVIELFHWNSSLWTLWELVTSPPVLGGISILCLFTSWGSRVQPPQGPTWSDHLSKYQLVLDGDYVYLQQNDTWTQLVNTDTNWRQNYFKTKSKMRLKRHIKCKDAKKVN